MPQPHPPGQLIRHRQNIPQRINLKLVKRLIHRRLQQRLELMHAILNLGRRIGVLDIAVAVGIRDRKASWRFVRAEAEGWRRQGEETVLDGFDGVVDDGVDGVDDFVDEGLVGGC